jgi:hypothetical protein
MTTAVRAFIARSRKTKRDAFRMRSNCEAAMAGASKAERSFLRRSIAVLDALIARLDISTENLRKLADLKPRKRVRRSARVGR